jgi:hypothetical protein
MSALSLEDFTEYLMFRKTPDYEDGFSWSDEDVSGLPIETTMPDSTTSFIEWAYENSKWIPTIGLEQMKPYFLSLIYTPYDEEMTDITTEIPEPKEGDAVLSLKNGPTPPLDSYESDNDDFPEEESTFKESDIMQLFATLMQSASLPKPPSSAEEELQNPDLSVD